LSAQRAQSCTYSIFRFLTLSASVYTLAIDLYGFFINLGFGKVGEGEARRKGFCDYIRWFFVAFGWGLKYAG